MPCIITNKQSAAMGKHFVIKHKRLDVDVVGNNTKNTATDLKNGTSLGPTCFTLKLKCL